MGSLLDPIAMGSHLYDAAGWLARGGRRTTALHAILCDNI